MFLLLIGLVLNFLSVFDGCCVLYLGWVKILSVVGSLILKIWFLELIEWLLVFFLR